jgi:hypothetical protein
LLFPQRTFTRTGNLASRRESWLGEPLLDWQFVVFNESLLAVIVELGK